MDERNEPHDAAENPIRDVCLGRGVDKDDRAALTEPRADGTRARDGY